MVSDQNTVQLVISTDTYFFSVLAQNGNISVSEFNFFCGLVDRDLQGRANIYTFIFSQTRTAKKGKFCKNYLCREITTTVWYFAQRQVNKLSRSF